MVAEIISVGTELLMGQTLNTNARFLARECAACGVEVYHQATVGDNPDRLREAIELALSRADLLLLTGGLGPTQDDITKEVAASVFGQELVLHQPSQDDIIERLRAYSRTITPNNEKQAMIPVGAVILKNGVGTAPGCILRKDNKEIVLLPGPPKECEPMFLNEVLPYLEQKSGARFYTRILRVYGLGESRMEYELRDMIAAQTNPTIAPYALEGEAMLRVTARAETEAQGRELAAPVVQEIQERLGDVVYSIDNETLEQVIGRLLAERSATLAVAESCTGGMLAAKIVNVPGSSAWFMEGFVTYSNDAKVRRLGVSAETLARHGAVSLETAREMAENLRQAAGVDYALSVTGVAGPDGGSAQKPVGLVYIGLATPRGVDVTEARLTGDRQQVRLRSAMTALDLLRRELLKH